MFIYKFDQHEKLVYKSTTPYILFDTQKNNMHARITKVISQTHEPSIFLPVF